MRINWFFIISLFLPLSISAQVFQSPEQIVGNLMESISEQEIVLNDHSQIFDDMIDLYEHPVDINTVSKQDLERLIFLSDIQIANILEFVKHNRPLSSKYQLQGIENMAINDIENLLLFIQFGEGQKFVHKHKVFKGQTIIRDQVDVEKASGYRSDTLGGGYWGNRHHLYSKVQANYGKNIFAGITLDKDPGETIFKSGYRSVDFVSMHLMYQGENFLKTLIVGDFHANFGQGLALWSGTSMGKTSEPLQVRKRGEGFRKYTSANEYSFFRGVAITMQMRNVELSVFASQKRRDASLKYDSINGKEIAFSLPETGYHRTESELNNRNRLQQKTIGANLNYRYRDFSISLGGYYHHYQTDSIAVKQMYKLLAYPKVDNNHYWLGYNYGRKRFISFGELAITRKGYFAILNGIQFNPSSNISLAMVHRYFSSSYYSGWTNAFTEYSSPSGESGLYMGAIILPLPKAKLSGSVDMFKNSWLKYNIDSPSEGYGISVQGDYGFSDRFRAYIRYQEKEKSNNRNDIPSPHYSVSNSNTKKIRLHTSFLVNEDWSLQMRIEKSYFKEEGQCSSEGILSYAGIKYISKNKKMALWGRYTIFCTDDYDSRIYAYENDLLYNFSTPSFQGEGTRMYFIFRYKMFENVKFWCKIGQTWYSDKTEIGSGLQAIKGNVRTTIKMQLQIKF